MTTLIAGVNIVAIFNKGVSGTFNARKEILTRVGVQV